MSIKKIIVAILFLFVTIYSATAQLIGDDTVCVGKLYNYTVNMPGAITYAWSFPSGWYEYSGAGTANVMLNVNVSDGQICVIGYDGNGLPVDTFCKTVIMGGGGDGWDVVQGIPIACWWSPVTFYITPNGTGGGSGCPGCGNGIPNPNVALAIYDGPWGIGSFVGFAANVPALGINGMTVSYYFYYIDYTFGIPTAVLVTGGCGSGAVNNVLTITLPWPPGPGPLFQAPDPVCIGDTVVLHAGLGFISPLIPSWVLGGSNIQLISANEDSAFILVTGPTSNTWVDLTFFDPSTGQSGCSWYSGTINAISCASTAPVAMLASSDTGMCDKSTVDFSDLSTNSPTSWWWSFPGASPSSSTLQNPTSIYYPNYGTYNVSLVACNSAGCDTILLPNFISIFQPPPAPTISFVNDTLWSSPAMAYQWYQLPAMLIANATQQYYQPTQAGTYFVLITDSNNCTAPSDTLVVNATAIAHNAAQGTITMVGSTHSGIYFLMVPPQIYIHTIRIYTIDGKLITSIMPTHNISNDITLDLQNIVAGTYIVAMQTENGLEKIVFVKN